MKPLEIIISVVIMIASYYYNLLYWGMGLVGIYFLSKFITIYRVTRAVRTIINTYTKEFNIRKKDKQKLDMTEVNQLMLEVIESFIIADTKLLRINESNLQYIKASIDLCGKGVEEGEPMDWYFITILKDILPFYFSVKDNHNIEGLEKDFQTNFMIKIIRSAVHKYYSIDK